jgi:cell volume regulation protein A
MLIPGTITLLLSVVFSKFSNKFGLPILTLFLAIGMIAGKESLGIVQLYNYELTHSISLFGLCLIIFSSGIMTKFEDIKPILIPGVSLSTFGVFHTTALVGGFCFYFLKVPFFECVLIGAILSSTDASAVFTAFNSKSSQINKRVKSILELESGSNDPMTYLLVILFLGFYQSEVYTFSDISLLLVVNPIVGFAIGYSMFQCFKYVNNNINLDFKGMYAPMCLAFVFLTYALTTKLQGNGFLAVYIFALFLGNTKILHKNAIMDFFDGTSWLAQIGLFIMLGLLVSPSRLVEVSYDGSVVALFLIFIARPVSVFLSTIHSQFSFKEKILISWGGLKGASPIVFACFVATKMGSETNLIFDLVFFAVVFSAILQGSTLKLLAKALKLQFVVVEDPKFPIDQDIIDNTKNGMKEITIKSTDYAVGKRIVDLKLPKGSLILFLKRESGFIIPNGSTEIKNEDIVLLVTPLKEDVDKCLVYFQKDQSYENEEL